MLLITYYVLSTILSIGEILVKSSNGKKTLDFVEIAIFFTYSIAPLSSLLIPECLNGRVLLWLQSSTCKA